MLRSRIFQMGTSLFLTLSFALPSVTKATPSLESFGMGLHPFTARILSTGAEAAYFSPALLSKIEEGVAIGFMLTSDHLQVNLLNRPSSGDISESIYKAWVQDASGDYSPIPFPPLPTSTLNPRQGQSGGPLHTYVTLGIVKHLMENYLSFGVLAVLPASTFQEQSAYFADEREQYFSNAVSHELYGDRLGAMGIVLSLGGDITSWVSWGLGLTMGLATNTTNPVYVPDVADQSNILITTNTQVNTSFTPHVSLAFTPVEDFQLSVSFHAPKKSSLSGNNRLKFWRYDYPDGEDAIPQTFKFTNNYDPMTVALAGAYEIHVNEFQSWSIGTELRWRQWSEYIDRVSERPTLPWRDTLSVALGADYRTHGTAFALDLGWFPSPIPMQVGRENYIDEDKIGISAAMEADFELFGSSFQGQIGLQVHRLLPRKTVKSKDSKDPVRDEFPDDAIDIMTGEGFSDAKGLQSNNPGWPGWTSSGWLLHAGVNLKVKL